MEWPLAAKVEAIAKKLYGAEHLVFLPEAQRKVDQLQAMGLGALPVCMAKTHLSLSDDSRRLGRPTGFTITIQGIRLLAGAGYVVCYAGKILTMPGLPRRPAAREVIVSSDGNIQGLR
jgi:formate--tetrahydrofolate ligase